MPRRHRSEEFDAEIGTPIDPGHHIEEQIAMRCREQVANQFGELIPGLIRVSEASKEIGEEVPVLELGAHGGSEHGIEGVGGSVVAASQRGETQRLKGACLQRKQGQFHSKGHWAPPPTS